MQTSPPPAHPSYRLITALRLLCVVPTINNLPSTDRDRVVGEWRNTTLGNQDAISSENERQWKDCLLGICEFVVANADEGLSRIAQLQQGHSDFSVNWLLSMSYIEMLWREESHVAAQVIASLEENIDF